MSESDEDVRGEPRPLSVLLPVACCASSAAAVIDSIRSSSGRRDKRSRLIQTDGRIDPNACAAFTLWNGLACVRCGILTLNDGWIDKKKYILKSASF